MKLPLDYKMPSLGDLKRVVVLMATGAEKWDESLEMTKEQYLRYKELVFKEDPIRFYNGMQIVLLEHEGDGEKRGGKPEGDVG